MTALSHLMAEAGNASLMTPGLCQTLCDHSAGNYRILTTLAAELPATAARLDMAVLDEKLYLQVFVPAAKTVAKRTAGNRA